MLSQTQFLSKPSVRKTISLDLPTLLLLAGMHLLFWGNFFLYYNYRLPILAHVFFGAVAIHCSFTIWHEAAHSNVSNKAWINNLTGILGMFPYMTPYFTQKYIHLQHHMKMNEKDDPNFIYTDGPFWQLPLRYPRGARYIKELLKKNPLKPAEKKWDTVSFLIVAAIYLTALVKGFLGDLIWLWIVPFFCAKIVMDWYVNYIPHAGLPPDRYRGTRIITARWLTPLVFGHNYHAIHHLWPRHPWYQYIPVFKSKRDELVKQGVPFESSPFHFSYAPGLGCAAASAE